MQPKPLFHQRLVDPPPPGKGSSSSKGKRRFHLSRNRETVGKLGLAAHASCMIGPLACQSKVEGLARGSNLILRILRLLITRAARVYAAKAHSCNQSSCKMVSVSCACIRLSWLNRHIISKKCLSPDAAWIMSAHRTGRNKSRLTACHFEHSNFFTVPLPGLANSGGKVVTMTTRGTRSAQPNCKSHSSVAARMATFACPALGSSLGQYILPTSLGSGMG